MRIAIIGQQAFGKAVLDAFRLGRRCRRRPLRPGKARRAPRSAAPCGRGEGAEALPTAQPDRPEAAEALRWRSICHGLCAAIRAARLRLHPEAWRDLLSPFALAEIPRAERDQLADHPRRGRDRLTVFRPNDGLDEGDIVLQKRTPIGADDTLGTVYFDRLFPGGGGDAGSRRPDPGRQASGRGAG